MADAQTYLIDRVEAAEEKITQLRQELSEAEEERERQLDGKQIALAELAALRLMWEKEAGKRCGTCKYREDLSEVGFATCLHPRAMDVGGTCWMSHEWCSRWQER